MDTRTLTVVAVATFLAACSSPPKPPTVDDSKRRPVNVSEAVNLQMCRTELSAARIVLTETLAAQHRLPVLPPVAVSPVLNQTPPPEPNQVFVITFAFASSDLTMSTEQKLRLVEQARAAKFIVIRGRTDSRADSMGETRLAQRRAEAAYNYLMGLVRLPPEGIRLSWQGAGDPLQSGDAASQREVNRRVEIELYQTKPKVEILNASTS